MDKFTRADPEHKSVTTAFFDADGVLNVEVANADGTYGITYDLSTLGKLVTDLHVKPLPRGEGADAPQSEIQDGNMPLLYTEQTFNELVAANTAMISELAARDEKILMMAAHQTDLENSIAELKANHADIRSSWDTACQRLKQAETENNNQRADIEYHRDRAAELQRKLDRSLGYLDRVLDDEESLRSPDTRVTAAPKPPVGPDLSSIPESRRKPRDSEYMMFPGDTLRTFDPGERRRRI